jgi:conjugative transfer pilus assembly protein TraH
MRNHTIALAASLAILSPAALANGVNDRMTQMFNAQANTTRPGLVESSTRGVVTGGNLMVRNPIVQPGGIGFDPPRFSAGCGGLDLHGGNLSFPSKEQYTATARAIAGNAAGYAFKMALGSICEKCESVMSDIQNIITELNLGNQNSCQIAMGMVDAVRPGGDTDRLAAGYSSERMSAAWSQLRGNASDQFDAWRPGPGNRSPAELASSDPEMGPMINANTTWRAMQQTGAFDWLGTDKETREQIMSLLGSVASCVPDAEGCSRSSVAGRGTPDRQSMHPTIRLQDLVATSDQRPPTVQVWICENAEHCLTANTNDRSLGLNLADRLIEAYNDPEDGIIAKINRNPLEGNTAFTAEQRLWVHRSGDFAGAIMRLAEVDALGAQRGVIELSQGLVAELIYHNVQQAIPALIASIAESGAAASAEGIEMLRNSALQLREDMNDIDRVVGRNSDTLHRLRQQADQNPRRQAIPHVVERRIAGMH